MRADEHEERPGVGEHGHGLAAQRGEEGPHRRPQKRGSAATRASRGTVSGPSTSANAASAASGTTAVAAGAPRTAWSTRTRTAWVSGSSAPQTRASNGMPMVGKVTPENANAGPEMNAADDRAKRRLANHTASARPSASTARTRSSSAATTSMPTILPAARRER